MTNPPTTARPGRGRPVAFTADARTVFLDAVAAGAKLHEAAQKAGVSRNVPAQHAKDDAAFRAALADAKTTGRQIRAQSMPHGESRYNHAGCRCPVCCRKATAARTARRAAAQEGATEPAQPIPITSRTTETPPSFSLARAS
ncbi:hypothetical protein [Streptomyces asiaticus]|uniref:hypothetical protein n=1 Tax=Streptomyces asiaticus TaxID=114695 RepID=UPI00381F511D